MALTYSDLSIAVTEVWNEVIKEVPPSFFKEQVKDAMGLAKPSSVEAHIRYYLEGIYYGTISNKPENPNERFERLSVFLFAIGFPGMDGKYQGILDGLERIAANRGDIFAFPPPEDKRISYEDIKANYENQEGSRPNNNEEKAEKDEQVSAHDTITSLLAASNGNNHAIGRHYGILTDEGCIRNVIDASEDYVSRLRLGISDLDGGNYREYAIPYPFASRGGERYIIFNELQKFLEAARGKEVRIAHRHKRTDGLPTVKMIAVDESTTVYYREGKLRVVLEPYALTAGKYMKVMPKEVNNP